MAASIGRKSAVNSVYSTRNITEDSVWLLFHTVWTTQCHTCWMSCFHWSNNTVSHLLNVLFPLIKQQCHTFWKSCSHWSNNTVSHLLNELFSLIKQHSVTPALLVVSTDQTTQCHTCWMSDSPWWNNKVSCLFNEWFPLFTQHSVTFHKTESPPTPLWEPQISQKYRYCCPCVYCEGTWERGIAPQILYLDNTKLSGLLQAPAPLPLRRGPRGPRAGLDVLVNLGFEPPRHHPACSLSLVTIWAMLSRLPS
jgi:hypothetical protein